MPDMQDPQITLHGYECHFEVTNIVSYIQYWILLPLSLREDEAKKSRDWGKSGGRR
jgi:hypothetical protein